MKTDPGYPEGHRRITQSDWDSGRAMCHKCGKSINLNRLGAADKLTPVSAGAETIVSFTCGTCGIGTHFHIPNVA